ncbi:MAG: pyruvate kinase [Selenomonadales bacterium]|nr:pyruvate kinase [Selenomonadales bacterium]MBR0324694.1 pyruvate kinase [Selenomonadales bacterium]
MKKKTKIVCTLGPSSDTPEIIEALLENGMNVARFNFSHGTHEEQRGRIMKLREVAERVGSPVAYLLDTKGPEMRLGKFADKKVLLEEGKQFIITGRDVEGTADICSVTHKNLPHEVAPGNRILLSDGLVELLVERVDGEDIITTILNTGEVSTGKRVAVPDVAVQMPFLSEKDIADIKFGVEMDMDFIAASFVQRASDILAIRRVLEEVGGDMQIIAKIENAEGVRNIDSILRVADGVMVARGDLGVEIPTEEVPVIQKLLIQKCNQAGKPVITATQMLESMIVNPRPTRAEASDIANAIMDGTDAIMLSGETAAGKYPIEAVKMMNKIAVHTEQNLNYEKLFLTKGIATNISSTNAISHATVQVAQELHAAAILTVSASGYTPRMISKYRPNAPIICVTPYQKTRRRVQLLRGVKTLLGHFCKNSDEMVGNGVDSAVEAGAVKEGDLVVITAGVPVGISGTTNMIRVQVIGDVLLRGAGIGQRAAVGNCCVASSIKDIKEKFKPGDILVTNSINEETARYAAQAAAIITEEGGLTSPAAIIGVSCGIPVIVGAKEARTILHDQDRVTVDAARGAVYKGDTNAR